MGILSNKSYRDAVALIPGREPVTDKPKGVRLKSIYRKDSAGRFIETIPHHLQNNDSEEASS
jgi:hypothetical protein